MFGTLSYLMHEQNLSPIMIDWELEKMRLLIEDAGLDKYCDCGHQR